MANPKTKKRVNSKTAFKTSVDILPNGSFDAQLQFLASKKARNGKISDQLLMQLIAKQNEKTESTIREKLIVSALSSKKLSDQDWSQLFNEVDVKPKLHRDSILLLVELALVNGQSAAVLNFAVRSKKDIRLLVQASSAGSSISDDALRAISELSNFDFEPWKKFAIHLDWLSSLVSVQKSEKLFESLIAIIQLFETGRAPKSISRTVVKKVVTHCVKTLLEQRFRLSLIEYFNPQKFDKENAVSLICSMSQLGMGSEIQVSMIQAFADAKFLEVISDRKVWSRVELHAIAEVCSHKQIFMVLRENPDLIDQQISTITRSRAKGLGFLIQLCDQFPDFAALIDPKHIAPIDVSIKPSAKIFSSISEKIVQEVNARNLQIEKSLTSAHKIEIDSLKQVIDKKTIESESLQRKVENLEVKINEVRVEKSLAQDTVVQQARIDALLVVAEIVDEIRIVLEEMEKVDNSIVDNLYRSSLRKIGKLEVRVILPTDKDRILDRNLFAIQQSTSIGTEFLGRPAYVFSIGGKEFVLKRGVVNVQL